MLDKNLKLRKKVAIVGSGYVGASIAYALTIQCVANEIILIDLNDKKANGEAKDICHGLTNYGDVLVYAGSYSDCSECDLVIITTGRGRKPGESRLDLMGENLKVMKDVVNSLSRYSFNGIILIVSNPVDILTHAVSEWMSLPIGRVIGSGCLLDTSRFVRVVSNYLKVGIEELNGYVVGEHGDNQIPVWSRMTINGDDVMAYCSQKDILWNEAIRNKLAEETKRLGAKIISEKGNSHYGIATCVCLLADTILNQKSLVASVSAPLLGEYGVRGISLSLPSVIGASGIETRIVDGWTVDEEKAFLEAADTLKRLWEQISLQ